MGHTIDTSNFNPIQDYALSRAVNIAFTYNAMLYYEIGAENYNALRRMDPYSGNEHDFCDANMVMLAALEFVLQISEDKAMSDIVAPSPEIADYISEIASDQRDLTFIKWVG